MRPGRLAPRLGRYLAAGMTVRHSVSADVILNAVREAGYGVEERGGESGRQAPGSFFIAKKPVLTVLSGLFLAAGFTLSLFGLSGAMTIPFYLAAMLAGGFYPARSGFASLKSLSMDMNFLMTVAVAGAAAIGEWAEGATVVFLFALGSTLQAYTMEKTRNSIRALMDLSPKEALVRRGGAELRLPVERIAVNDVIIVKPGERIAMDGVVLAGRTDVNQSPITGESMPVAKKPGDQVYAGTINGQGAVEVRVTKLVEDSTLAKITGMVEEAQASKAPSQQFVDVFAGYYTPAVITGAALLATLPWLAFGQPFQPWFERALILLVISCPCALVISTPVTIVAAIGSAARRGVLIKGGAYLEEAGALKVAAFDKTGTLTEGRPEVTDVIPAAGVSPDRVLGIAAAIESRSRHPLAEAVLRHVKSKKIPIPEGEDFRAVDGKGAAAAIGGETCYIGSTRLFEELGVCLDAVREPLAGLQARGRTAMIVGTAGKVLGVIAVADRIRESGKTAVEGLRRAGIARVVMLSGDNAGTAGVVAAELGIDEYRAELLPEDKLEAIRSLQKESGSVAMVGDGVNDAPALAAATVGIAMGGAGSDAALETAGVVLMAGDLASLPYVVTLSRRALKIIKQNIALALMIKAAFIAGTLIGVTSLWMAVFADTGASLMVIANGMRLMSAGRR
ncbi:MAG: cadmium-translocating P-type ATPase [Firmicutes bacterium]|nr:cadmium-translocating P-type ATPase [Bacillota bacterium]